MTGLVFLIKLELFRTRKFIDPVFTKTSPKRSFSVIENERFGLVFANTGSIIRAQPTGFICWEVQNRAKTLEKHTFLQKPSFTKVQKFKKRTLVFTIYLGWAVDGNTAHAESWVFSPL